MKIGENAIIEVRVPYISLENVDEIIFTFQGTDKIKKIYPSSSISHDAGSFFIDINQEDTLILARRSRTNVSVEAQVNYKNGSVCKTNVTSFVLDPTLNTEILLGNKPSRNITSLDLHYVGTHLVVGGAGEITDEQIRRALPNVVTKDELGTTIEEFMEEHPEYQGQPGTPGRDGKDPYELAVENGYEGTLEEWLDDLKGEAGNNGEPGESAIPELENYFRVNGIYEDLSSYHNAVSITDFGAVGDGVTDDSQALIDAIGTGTEAKVIVFPKGKYNLNNISIVLEKPVTFIGETSSFTYILNSNIAATKGIVCKNLTFEGGTSRLNYINTNADRFGQWNHTLIDKEVILWVSPHEDDVNVEYYNCVFRNSDMASMAFLGPQTESNGLNKRIANNIIKNCVFENLTTVAILHMVNITNAEITDNKFYNIGSLTTNVTRTAAIGIGDCGDTTNNVVDNAVIENNHIENFITPFNDVTNGGKGAYNMIQVKGDKLKVLHNVCKNFVGYGQDKEAIYTKGHYVEVAFNEVTNGGSGEAYICCKPYKGITYLDRICNIHDNTLIGEFGNGISGYGTCKITNNTVMINRAKSAIKGYAETDKAFGTIDIVNNHISCGIGALIVNGEEKTDYVVGEMICVDRYPYGVNITNNTIAVEQFDNVSLTYVIKAQNLISDAKISKNKIAADSVYGIGITTSSTYNDSIKPGNNVFTIEINDNLISTMKKGGVSINLSGLTLKDDNNEYKIKCEIFVRNNLLKGLTSTASGVYPIIVWDRNDNEDDFVVFETQQDTSLFSVNKHIGTNVNTVYANVDPSLVVNTRTAPSGEPKPPITIKSLSEFNSVSIEELSAAEMLAILNGSEVES